MTVSSTARRTLDDRGRVDIELEPVVQIGERCLQRLHLGRLDDHLRRRIIP